MSREQQTEYDDLDDDFYGPHDGRWIFISVLLGLIVWIALLGGAAIWVSQSINQPTVGDSHARSNSGK